MIAGGISCDLTSSTEAISHSGVAGFANGGRTFSVVQVTIAESISRDFGELFSEVDQHDWRSRG